MVLFHEKKHTIKIQHSKFHGIVSIDTVNIIPSKQSLIIQIEHGGLGDHLFHSHLPRIAKQTGKYDRVYISNHSPFRNRENKLLIWEMNPYIDGFCDNEGAIVHGLVENACEVNLLDQIMLFYGLDDNERFHEPEIYYTPAKINSIQEKIVFDPNYVSNAGNIKHPLIRNYFRSHSIYVDYQMKLRDKSSPILEFNTSLEASSLKAFCNIIISCKDLFCYASGTATLAAALNKPAHVLCDEGAKKIFHHSKLHNYIYL